MISSRTSYLPILAKVAATALFGASLLHCGDKFTAGETGGSGGGAAGGGGTGGGMGGGDGTGGACVAVGCTGVVAWVRVENGNDAVDVIHDVAVDAAGNSFAAGELKSGSGDTDGRLIFLDANGATLRGVTVNDAGGSSQTAKSVALGEVGSAGGIFLAGDYMNAVAVGGVSPMSDPMASGTELYLAELNLLGGAQQVRSFGSAGNDEMKRVVVAPNGDVIVTATVRGDVTVDSVPTAMSKGSSDILVMALDGATLEAKWVGLLGGARDDVAGDVAVTKAGDVVVVGEFKGMDKSRVEIVKLSGVDGTEMWSARSDETLGGAARGNGVEVGPDGSIYVVGYYDVQVKWGDETLLAGSGNRDGFIVKLTDGGVAVDSRSIGMSSDLQEILDVEMDSQGNLLLAGTYKGTPILNETPEVEGASWDAFALKLSGDLTPLWSRVVASDGTTDALGDRFHRVAVDGTGNAYFGGEHNGTFTLDGMEYPNAAGARRMLLTKVGP